MPIPSYLLAIAVGNVRYNSFSKPSNKQWSSGVWAEPEVIESAFWEFSEDTTRYVSSDVLGTPGIISIVRFLSTEEDIVTNYKFGVYDLLVLPPSFPYGGMVGVYLHFCKSEYLIPLTNMQENACLSFLTPSKH